MIESMFDVNEWMARLGASLETLAPTATFSVSHKARGVSQLSYDEFRALQERASRDPTITDAVDSVSASLKQDPVDQRAILREHPVLKNAWFDNLDGGGITLVCPYVSYGIDTERLVSNLVAQTVRMSGPDAAGLMHRFLADGRKRRLQAREFVVIYGLKLVNRIQLADGTFIAPLNDSFPSDEGFSDEEAQRMGSFGVASRAFRDGRGGSAVLARDLRWGPGVSICDQDPSRTDIAGKLPCERETLLDLLSIASHRPLATSTHHVRLPKWIHRIEPLLASGHWGGGGFVNEGWWREDELSGEAEARFRELVAGWVGFEFGSDQDRDALRLVVRRLAGSFGRIGRMELQDRILDYAITLEILYRLDKSELTYKLAMRAACLLEEHPDRRLAIFEKMTEFYDIRSAIVHGPTTRRHRKLGDADFERACENGRDLACDTLSSLLRRKCFPNWKKLVFETGTEPKA